MISLSQQAGLMESQDDIQMPSEQLGFGLFFAFRDAVETYSPI
jgi:hypothetical protein